MRPKIAQADLPLNKVRVLVVEDDDDIRQLMTAMLNAGGAAVDSVDSAEEAIHEIEDFLPDVIVSDLAMPGQSGFDFVRGLRKAMARHHREIPVLAVSGLPERSTRPEAMAAGFQAYIPKPFRSADLLAAVARLTPKNAGQYTSG